jgi:hypothetical protein
LKEAIGKKLSTITKPSKTRENNKWHKGFDTLQNINDRMALEKELKQAKDPLF